MPPTEMDQFMPLISIPDRLSGVSKPVEPFTNPLPTMPEFCMSPVTTCMLMPSVPTPEPSFGNQTPTHPPRKKTNFPVPCFSPTGRSFIRTTAPNMSSSFVCLTSLKPTWNQPICIRRAAHATVTPLPPFCPLCPLKPEISPGCTDFPCLALLNTSPI